ncbi:GTPase-activating protein [Fusarium globosum]|uniref:GTPase-activating protein n=1 Tax=Fusarium globosum TaxID=78864 RepID=A0A8H6DGD5_9HYPO|nr:GTPase-activating protein [Fusarium globosum]
MDPLSIASSVVGLTATCLSTCKKLHDLAGEYQDVPAVIAMICSESTIISIGLSELQMKILRRDDLAQAWASKTEIWMAFETALTGCMVVFSCLEAETRSLRSKNPGVWAKIKFIWNQDRLKDLLGALRGQQSSITFLLNLLELETLSNIQKDVRENAPRIKAAASEAQSLRSCNPSVKMNSGSVFDNDATKLGFFEVEAVSGNAPSELDFEFDDLVINSQAYRRVFIKAQAETKQPEIEELDSDTGTVREVDKSLTVSQKEPTSLGRVLREKTITYAKDLVRPSIRTEKDCGTSLENGYRLSKEENGIPPKPLCEEDYIRRRDIKCFRCHETITGYFLTALDRRYHAHHFTCDRCDIIFATESDYHQHNAGIYCLLHFCREVAYYCHACKFPIIGRYSEKSGEKAKWHTFCFELSAWGLDILVSANGREYLDSIEDSSTTRLTKFYQELHDSRANDIYLCGSSYLKDFQEIVAECLRLFRAGQNFKSYPLFRDLLAMLSCLFKSIDQYTTDHSGEGEVGAFVSSFKKHFHFSPQGWQASPQVAAQCVSELLKPLLRLYFGACLQSNDASWDVENDQLDELIKTLEASRSSELEQRYNDLPSGIAIRDWRCSAKGL